jgi:hypothetical protein
MFCRNIFEEYRAHLHTFFPKVVEPVPWAFDPSVVFERKMQYVERLEIIEVRVCRTQMCHTCVTSTFRVSLAPLYIENTET